MSHSEFKPPRRTPSRRGHLERLTGDYGRAHGIAHERARRWLSLASFAGALDSVRADDGARFLIKGGASMELRLGMGARTTKDIDVVFRGAPGEMLDALEEAFAQPYGNFSFRRKGPAEDIRETGSRRLFVQVSFAGKDWQTLQIEVARPEATEAELVPVAIGIADFKLMGPERVACLALRYQVAQKLHAVTEQPDGRANHRFWDLIDLQLQRELLGNNLARVREAYVEIFIGRDLQPWPPGLVIPEDWREPYAAVAGELDADLPLDVDSAANQVRDFIAVIDAAG
ncbi:MAG TPA: nucleotidyl transferase AbiEii/AbiGii toxin family protein [Solirubrobacterales bacterium]|nr:nucleotidyl transferase AbiEii/AbiGii toxin family protein [Solirubrobacterales bacterium]